MGQTYNSKQTSVLFSAAKNHPIVDKVVKNVDCYFTRHSEPFAASY